MKSAMFIPPHIDPPEKVRKSFGLLRDCAKCVIRTWPRQVYKDDFYEGPAGNLLYVMKPEAIRAIFVEQPELFPQSQVLRRILSPIWREGIATAVGEQWRWQRKAASPVFTPQASLAVAPVAQETADKLLTSWENGSEEKLNILKDLSTAATDVVLDMFLGVNAAVETRKEIHHWSAKITEEMGRINYADILFLPNWTRRFLGPTFQKPADQLHKVVRRALIDRPPHSEGSSSLLNILAKSKDVDSGNHMSIDLLSDNIAGSLAAGRETTSLGITWALYLTAHDRTLQDRLANEVKRVAGNGPITAEHIEQLRLVQSVFMEALRLYPPAPQIGRDCIQDTTIAGREVKRGTFVVIPIYAIQRHHAHWESPDIFDPERFMPGRFDRVSQRYSFMPFGAGQRICLGMSFATVEATVILANLFRRMVFKPTQQGPMDFDVGAALRPRFEIILSYERR